MCRTNQFGYGSIPMKIPFLVERTPINPSYFDVNYRGTIGFDTLPFDSVSWRKHHRFLGAFFTRVIRSSDSKVFQGHVFSSVQWMVDINESGDMTVCDCVYQTMHSERTSQTVA